ncbi:iron complex outermembrane receptor protein [Algoriphagus boseongensis]|uniref:Iron complex outermembrane receptor protein n=1 Tax=Algoriphagus boseongensis TaxID=1442587 RepID=A0A4R6T5H4_9BACT|nr:TonB-dependent receptor [Algoriphagus boseongensis]TDQ16549.1 iron complex outermembrane receptor protein [Algoriphagus boseongensis]
MKKLIKPAVGMIFALALVLYTLSSAFAQQTKNLQIKDSESQESIPGVTYRYGFQRGVSDENGQITLLIDGETWLYLSHLSYGSWTLDPKEVAEAANSGLISRQEQLHGLQPVSVISLKMSEEKDKKILISDQERLHHDAGAILGLDPVVSGIRKSSSFGFDPVMRGFKYDQLNIVVNGLQSANAACPNRMDPPTSQIALNRIREVEILKGPHALRYGIGLGGTINYIQETPNFTSYPGIYGRVSSMFETNGDVWRNDARIGFQGSNYDIGVLGSYSVGSDYLDGDGNPVPANFKRGTLGIYADFQATNRDLVQFTVNRNFARNVDFPSLGMDLRNDDTWMGSLKHTRVFSGKSLAQWTNSVYFTKVDHLMDNLLREPRMMDASTPAITQNWGFRSEGEWKFAQGKLYAGVDYKEESADGTRTRVITMGPMAGKVFYDNIWQDSQISKTGFFANYLFPLGGTVITASGRLEINEAIANNPAEEFIQLHPEMGDTQLNPGISIGAQRDLGKVFSLGIWAASVRRSGSLLERYINYLAVGMDPWELIGDPQIKPETNNELDLVLGYGREKISLELTLFGSYLTDYISSVKTNLKPRLATSPGVRQYVNVDKAVKTGIEINFKQQLTGNLSHSLGLAYTYGQDLVLDAPLPEIAPLDLRYGILGQFLDRKLQTGINLRHVIAQERVSEAFGEGSTPGFTLLDLDVRYPIGKILLVKGGVQNIFDETYYEHLSRPIGADKTPMYAPGRNYFVMVSFKFP